MFSLIWLPDVLQAAGLKVAETPDWRIRGRAEMGELKGVMCHHTATPKHVVGNLPSLNLLINGRAASGGTPALAGPLAQLALGRDGTFYIIAAGRANHAGSGRWQGLVDVGNSSFIGIEAENSGLPDDRPWPEVQLEAYCRGAAALLQKIGAGPSMCCGHKEYATPTGRKIDPTLDMAVFRSRVASFLGGSPAKPLIAAMDGAQRLTLRRGANGSSVKAVQELLRVPTTGAFDAIMEAQVREYQRRHGLVGDGIIGPATWNALQPTASASAPIANDGEPAVRVQSGATNLADLPPAETNNQPVKVSGLFATSPDGTSFAHKSGPGFMTLADRETKLSAWLRTDEANGVRLSDSQKRVLSAMSVNEGGLEAVNSYDSSFLSFGAFQWTTGAGNEPGELPALLGRFKVENAEAYSECFDSTGIDVVVANGASTGYFAINGADIRTSEDKSQLRGDSWAYTFWRAGHHQALRTCEAEVAVLRINLFYDLDIEGRPVRDWITSELGVALLLDEHVNRPSHVQSTLQTAVRLVKGELPADPKIWTIAEEHRLIQAYLQARRQTTMTNSDKRASTIMAFVAQNALSDARNSYSEH